MSSPPFVTIVVPTWNRAVYLPGCLESLLNQDYPREAYEIVVVDDGSTDGTQAAVRAAQAGPGGSLIRYVHQKHGGVNAARNAGVRAARGELLAFIDDDELAPPGYLAHAARLLAKHPQAAGVGGPYREYGPGCLRTCKHCSLAASNLGETGDITRQVPALPGGNMVLRRRAFDIAGPFDSDISGIGDEWEWFQRVVGQDLVFYYDSTLWVHHRKDLLSPWRLCLTTARQGLSVPLAASKAGLRYRPSLVQLVRYFGHGLLRACGGGLILACREAGALVGFLLPQLASRLR